MLRSFNLGGSGSGSDASGVGLRAPGFVAKSLYKGFYLNCTRKLH